MANFLAMATLIAPGDEVIFEQPTYAPMLSAAQFLGADIRQSIGLPRMASGSTSTGSSNWPVADELIVITNLHNPTGALTGEDDLQAMAPSPSGAALMCWSMRSIWTAPSRPGRRLRCSGRGSSSPAA